MVSLSCVISDSTDSTFIGLPSKSPAANGSPFGQELALFGRFHAFGHDLHLQGVAERDDGRHDGGVLGVLLQVSHEAAIDLQFRGRQALQV